MDTSVTGRMTESRTEYVILAVVVAAMLLRLIFPFEQGDEATAYIVTEYTVRIGLILACLWSLTYRQELLTALSLGNASGRQLTRALKYALVGVGLVALDQIILQFLRLIVWSAGYDWHWGIYPQTSHAAIIWIDLTIGLALVAVSEEFVFRGVARRALEQRGVGRIGVITLSALFFSAFHWWHGVPNILSTAILGAIFMAVYIRTNSLWPVILAHYGINLIVFSAHYGLWAWNSALASAVLLAFTGSLPDKTLDCRVMESQIRDQETWSLTDETFSISERHLFVIDIAEDAAVISLGDQVPQYYRHRGFFNDGSLLATKIVERGSRMIVFQLRLIPDRDGFSVEYTDVPGLFRGTCSSRH